MIIKTRNNETGVETDVFEATENSACMVQRCQSCDQIHILLFKHRDDNVAAACIDMRDGFAEQIAMQLVGLIAQARAAARIAPVGSDSTH